MTRSDLELPLFPLGTVLLPGGPLMLRIFETRYLDMVSRCMRDESGFVVVLLREGGEVGEATFHDIGTLAKIVDWHQYDDGLLGITAIGQCRVQIAARRRQRDGLNVGRVRMLPPDPTMVLPGEYQYMARLLEQLLEQLGQQYAHVEHDFSDAAWVACRLAEILPLSNEQKQACLELTQPIERLEMVARTIKEITQKNA